MSKMMEIDPTRTLFIWGPARSGTTVLQNALNSSPDIYLFGEPDLESNWGAGGFCSWYNQKHVSFDNQETKSTYLPPILPEEANAEDYFGVLARHYRWVGAKLTLGPHHHDFKGLYGFFCRHFFGGVNLCVLRKPSLSISSVQRTWGIEDLDVWKASFVRSWLLLIHVYRNFPRGFFLFAEQINSGSFRALEEVLGCSLAHASEHYRTDRRYAGASVPGFEELDEMYDEFRELFNPANLQLQKDIRGLEEKRSGFKAVGLGESYVRLKLLLESMLPKRAEAEAVSEVTARSAPEPVPGIAGPSDPRPLPDVTGLSADPQP